MAFIVALISTYLIADWKELNARPDALTSALGVGYGDSRIPPSPFQDFDILLSGTIIQVRRNI